MNINFEKDNGLVPAIIQDASTAKVLMLGYMNQEAYEQTMQTKKVTFFSRSKQRLWTKGETSGNFLNLVEIQVDCDNDTLLIKANPTGPTCHLGTDTCWGETNEKRGLEFLSTLQAIIDERKTNQSDESYTSSLFKKGTAKIAQKVGEEAVETVIAALENNNEELLNESADLLYHLIVLLRDKNQQLSDVVEVLRERNKDFRSFGH